LKCRCCLLGLQTASSSCRSMACPQSRCPVETRDTVPCISAAAAAYLIHSHFIVWRCCHVLCFSSNFIQPLVHLIVYGLYVCAAVLCMRTSVNLASARCVCI
jgi:hypothetical protein